MEYNSIYEEPQGSALLGTVGALIGALLGAVVWALVGLMGYMASIVGFLIAFLASKGYDLMHGRPGKWKLLILILCVILAVIAGNLGTCAVQIHQVFTEEGYSSFMSEGQFFELMLPALAEDSDFISAITKDTLMGILFAALGCFGLLRQTVSGKQQKKTPNADAQPVVPQDQPEALANTADSENSAHEGL